MQKEKGITLIALIITIIVMLILVGVTVNVALNGGLFTNAKDAATEYSVETEKEQLQMAYYESVMYKNNPQKSADFETLEEYFLNKSTKDIIDTVDSEKAVFTNGIEVLFDYTFVNEVDGKEYNYANFDYNNKRYRITINSEGIVEKLEELPKLEIANAEIDEILNGWSVKFNTTGNEYILLEDGSITVKDSLYQKVLENPDEYIYSKVIGYTANGWDEWMIYDISSDGYVRIVPVVGGGNSSSFTEKYKYNSSISNQENLNIVLGICNKFINSNFAKSATLITGEEFGACYLKDTASLMNFRGFIIDQSRNILTTQLCNYTSDETPNDENEHPVIPVIRLKDNVKVKDGGSKNTGYEIFI